MINIKGLNKARVLKALYNRSRAQGMGYLHPLHGTQMTYDQAQNLLGMADDKIPYIDYLWGRMLKVDISGDTLDPRLYDRDNGEGAAEEALLLEFTEPTNA